MKKFNEQFRELMKNKGYNMTSFANKINKKSGWINGIDKGNTIPRLNSLNLIMEALELNVKEKTSLLRAWELAKGETGIIKNELDSKDQEIKNLREVIEVLRVSNSDGAIPYFPEVSASAGYGCQNTETCEEYINVPLKYAKEGNIAITVTGDSMSPKIQSEDIIIVDTLDQEFCDKKICVVNFNDDLYVKTISTSDGEMSLVSVNPFYPPIRVKRTDHLKIIGRVVSSFRDYN